MSRAANVSWFGRMTIARFRWVGLIITTSLVTCRLLASRLLCSTTASLFEVAVVVIVKTQVLRERGSPDCHLTQH